MKLQFHLTILQTLWKVSRTHFSARKQSNTLKHFKKSPCSTSQCFKYSKKSEGYYFSTSQYLKVLEKSLKGTISVPHSCSSLLGGEFPIYKPHTWRVLSITLIIIITHIICVILSSHARLIYFSNHLITWFLISTFLTNENSFQL